MAKFHVEVELDCLNDEDMSIDEEIRYQVVEGVKEQLLQRASKDVLDTVDKEIAQAIFSAKETIENKIDEFLGIICAEQIEKIQMPVKANPWSNNVEYIPFTEFVGRRYETFLKEKHLDKNGNVANYSGDRVYSISEYLVNKYLDKELTEKVAQMIKQARQDAEDTIIKSLEQSLKENLAAETIDRMNIPQILKNLQKQKEGYEQISTT